MILLFFAGLGVLTGILFQSRSPRQIRIRALLLPILAFLLKAGAARFLPPQMLALPVCLMQYGLLIGFLFYNWRLSRAPVLLLLIGTLLNFAVIALNDGCMPVDSSLIPPGSARLIRLTAGEIYAYTSIQNDTILPFLGDVLPLRIIGGLKGFLSIGDLLMGIGAGLFCFSFARNAFSRKRTVDS